MAHSRASNSNRILDIEVALVTEAAAFATGDLVADKITFANVGERALDAVRIVGCVLKDLAAQDHDYDLILFDADPIGTTFTKNAALDIADTDLPKVCAILNIDTPFMSADNGSLRGEPDMPAPFVLAGTSLYGALISRGSPTYAAITDLSLRLVFERC
jgi:hypothetical protein